MANVVRDPREHPEAILPDLATNPFGKFDRSDVSLVYGSLWKQRYLTKVGDDYFVQPAQWDVTHRTWRRYFVEAGTDWWAGLYPPDNMQRPTGPLRRMPFGGLRRANARGRRMECRLRALPWSGQRARRVPYASQHF
jgi:hypothetical protein